MTKEFELESDNLTLESEAMENHQTEELDIMETVSVQQQDTAAPVGQNVERGKFRSLTLINWNGFFARTFDLDELVTTLSGGKWSREIHHNGRLCYRFDS